MESRHARQHQLRGAHRPTQKQNRRKNIEQVGLTPSRCCPTLKRSAATTNCLQHTTTISRTAMHTHATAPPNPKPPPLLSTQTLKNNSVLKMAAAHEPEVPTRLYKPLPNFRLAWMKKKLEQAEGVIKGSVAGQQPSGGAGSMHHMLPPGRPQAPYALRVRALAAQLAGLSSAQATAGRGGSSTASAGAQQE